MAKKPNKLPNLETSLADISKLIDEMEDGEQTLEQSLAHFEQGISLIKHCQHILQEAEQKVQILLNQDQLAPYGDEEEQEDDN